MSTFLFNHWSEEIELKRGSGQLISCGGELAFSMSLRDDDDEHESWDVEDGGPALGPNVTDGFIEGIQDVKSGMGGHPSISLDGAEIALPCLGAEPLPPRLGGGFLS